MNFLFDNNLPPSLAAALQVLCAEREPDVQRVASLRELFSEDTEDLEWIPGLAALDTNWYVVTRDKFRKSKGAEREALRRAGHTTYVLDASWKDYPFWSQSVQIVRWWPRLLEHARLTNGGVHRVPWKFSPTRRFDSM